ncbi:MAG TPA: butyrate kinase [Thermoguttaceae bacterium]|nr:butyrate kinase [Thermoguttaceae bacterium]
MSRAASPRHADRRGAKKRDLVIVVNPGSTSTKLAVYRGPERLAAETIDHPKAELAKFAHVADQYAFRRDAVLRFLDTAGVDLEACLAVAGRGGLTKPLAGGVYRVNSKMLRDLRSVKWGEHPSNLGAPIAHEIAKRCGAPAFIVDPVVVDEFWPPARYAGHPAFERRSRFHALSQRAAARRAARERGVAYEKVNFVVAHLGGGISIGAHRKGRVVDVNDALDGDGPFSPERSGSLPTGPLVACCFSGRHTQKDVQKMLVGHGGLFAYLGTIDCREVERRIRQGDEKAREVYEAMAYQIAKWIGASAAVLSGQVEAVVLTGGMAASKMLVRLIRKYAGFVGPFVIYPEVEEMIALATSVQAAMAGAIRVQEYR